MQSPCQIATLANRAGISQDARKSGQGQTRIRQAADKCETLGTPVGECPSPHLTRGLSAGRMRATDRIKASATRVIETLGRSHAIPDSSWSRSQGQGLEVAGSVGRGGPLGRVPRARGVGGVVALKF